MSTVEELESWVRGEIGLPPEATVAISEKPGTDPRCSDVVTEVAVASPGEAPYTFHIERPLDDVVAMDVVAVLAFGGGH
ncbi:MAG: hypothetical protein ABR511_00350 [Acidimicrobiales bacterium]